MSATYVQIRGQTYDTASLKLPSSGRIFREAWDGVNSDGTIAIDPAKKIEILHKHRAAYRQSLQDAGFVWQGYSVGCSTTALALLNGLRSTAERSPVGTTYKFVDENGRRVTLTRTNAVALVQAAEDFVQRLFVAAGTVDDDIDAGTVNTFEEIENHTAWQM